MSKPLACIPTERSEVWWQQRHQQKLDEKAAFQHDVELLFLGDSITHAWEVEGDKYWQQHFAHRHAFNLGFAGDRTEHLLWRIQNGEIDGLSPKWVILLIGTNNAGHRLDEPEDIAAGVQLILAELKQRLPQSKILLMAIFPRSRNTHKPMRQRVDASNQFMQPFADQTQVYWLNINSQFLTADGVLVESVMPDLLHLDSSQYAVWGKAMLCFIEQN